MPLTLTEKVLTRHHLGYLNVSSVATFILGTPAGVDATFMVENAMNLLLEEALPKYRDILQMLEATEAQRFGDQELLAITRIGDISVDPEEQKKLATNYRYWQGRLVNMLGLIVNPYSKVAEDAGNSVNAPVVG